MAKIAVTGGSGFIGSHVVDALVNEGHSVTVIDHRTKPHRPDVKYEDVDLLDLSSVLAATREAEHVFHLAAVSNVNHAFKYPVFTASLNVMGTSNVLEAARINGVKRVHFASTVWVYNGAPGKDEVEETSPFYMDGAGHIYTSTKMAAEMLFHNYRALYGVPFTIWRYGIPYGPRMREELLIPFFLKRAFSGEPLTVAGQGDQFRRFVFVRDLAKAHIVGMGAIAENQTYNLEGVEKVTVLQVAENIRRLVGDHIKIVFGPERPGDFAGREVSAEKAKRELGWAATTKFEDGLKQTVDWFRQRWAALPSPKPPRGASPS